MATGILTNTTKDASGVAVGSLAVSIVLKPGPGYKSDTATELARKLITTSDASGFWSVALEQNANISPANSYYEVYEPVPESGGGPITSAVRVVSGTQTVYAARITNPAPAPAEGAITQTAADARYYRIGNPVQTNSANTFTADQYFTSGRPWVDAVGKGADPTGAADSTAAIQSAIDALPARGGTVFFPPGIYLFTSVTAAGKTSIRFQGTGGPDVLNGQASTLKCTATGTTSAVILRNTIGVIWDAIGIKNSNSGFTGRLLDFRNITGSDTSYGVIRDSLIGGIGTDPATAIGIDLDGANFGSYSNVVFGRIDTGASGRDPAGRGYSGNHTWVNCKTSSNLVKTRLFKNPGSGWVFLCQGNEPLEDGTAMLIEQTDSAFVRGFVYLGGETGDSTGGYYIRNLKVVGALIGGWEAHTLGAGGTDMDFQAGGQGIVVAGVRAESGTNIAAAASQRGFVLLGNDFQGTTKLSAGGATFPNIVSGAIIGNNGQNDRFINQGRPTVSGSRAGNAALASFLTAFGNAAGGLGLLTDGTTA